MIFFLALCIVWLLILWKQVYHLKDRITHMESYLKKATERFGKQTADQHVVQESEDVVISQIVESLASTQDVPQNTSTRDYGFVTCLKRDWLMKLGGFS